MTQPDAMDAETLEALQGSIRKWEKIVDGTGENGGAYNCPLCVKFNSSIQPGASEFAMACCDGCPVHAATGKHGCKGSPYELYEDAEDEDSVDEMELRDLACDELNFLKSLLPHQEELPPHIERAIASEGGQGG